MVAPNQPAAPAESPRPVSRAKRRANRRNAQSSTGPRTPQGKARSARNATTHGIFCRDLLLPGEDEQMFRWIREGVIRRLRPQDPLELMLVDRVVQAQWRLNRCQAAEHLDHDHQASRVREHGQREIRRFERRHGTRQELLDDPQPGDDRLLFDLDLLERIAATDITGTRGLTLHVALRSNVERTLERLSGYEQRLERGMHRALLELRLLRGTPTRTWADLPPSPYAGRLDAALPEDEEEDDRDEHDGDKDAPTPSPRYSGEREPEAPAQNEPTAENVAASTAPATSSDDPARQRPRGPDAARPHDPSGRAPAPPSRDPRR